jgi:hypothetical protein
MADINILTPLEDTTRRKEQVRLLQLVVECTDGDYLRAFTTVRPAQVPPIVEARRAGIFDYGQTLLDTDAGRRWPSAPAALAAIEKAVAGELTIESPEWKEIVNAIGLDENTRTQDGTKVKSEAHFFHLVTKFDQLEDGSRKTKRFSAPRKKAPRKKAAPKKVEPTVTPEKKVAPKKTAPRKAAPEKTAPLESEEDYPDLMGQLAGAFQALDERIMSRLDDIEKKVGAEEPSVADAVSDLQKDMNQSFSGMFRALQLVAKTSIALYYRQEEIALDPMGDCTEMSPEDLEELTELATYSLDGEDAPANEDPPDVEEDPPKDNVVPFNGAVESQERPDASNEGESITLDAEIHGKMSDEDFAKAVKDVLDIEIHDTAVLDGLSMGKMRVLGDRLGVPGAKGMNYRPLLKTRIVQALSPE